MKKLILVITMILLPVTANATTDGNMTGNEIVTFCEQPKNSKGQFFCIGWIRGMMEHHLAIGLVNPHVLRNNSSIFEPLYKNCVPSGTNPEQIRGMFMKEMRDNPTVRHKSAVILLIQILNRDFPCDEGI